MMIECLSQKLGLETRFRTTFWAKIRERILKVSKGAKPRMVCFWVNEELEYLRHYSRVGNKVGGASSGVTVKSEHVCISHAPGKTSSTSQ